VADLEVSAKFVLEGAKDLAGQLEQAGRAGGQVFGESLSTEAQKRLDGIVNQAEAAAKRVGLAFNKTKLRFEDASGQVVPDDVFNRLAKLDKGLKDANRSLGQFAKEAEATAKDAGRSFSFLQAAVEGVAFSLTNTLTQGIVGAGGAITGALRSMVGEFGRLDTELRKAAAADGAADAYEKIAVAVDKVGIEASGTTLEVAQLATELIRGGMSVDQMNDSLAAIVRGAEATGTGFADMGSNVSAALKGFGLPASEAVRVVDAMTQGANASAASVTGLGMAFKYSAPVAKILGVSIEELGVAVGLLTNAGIDASEAGVTLRNGLSKLAAAAPVAGGGVRDLSGQAGMAAKAMKKLGLDIYETDGTLKPMEETLLRLKRAFNGLEPSAKIGLASSMFGGEDDGTKWLALLNQSESEIRRMSAAMQNTKGSTDAAREAMQGFELKLKQLDGTLGSIGNTFGGLVATALIPLVNAANTVAGAIVALPGPVKTATAALVLLTGGLVAARVALIVFQQALAITQVQAAIGAIQGLSGVIRGRLIADLALASGALKAFGLAIIATGNTPVAFAAIGLAIKTNIVAAATAGIAALQGLAVAIKSGALLASLQGLAAGAGGLAVALGPIALAVGAVVGAVAAWNYTLGGANKVGGEFAATQKDIDTAAAKLNATLGKTAVEAEKSKNAIQELFDRARAARTLEQLSGDADRLQNSFTKLQEPALAFMRILQRSSTITDKAKQEAAAYATALDEQAAAARSRAEALRKSAIEEDVGGNTAVADKMRAEAAVTDSLVRANENLANALRNKTGQQKQATDATDAATEAQRKQQKALEDATKAESKRKGEASIRQAQGETEILQLEAAFALTREQAEERRRILALQTAQAEQEAQMARLQRSGNDPEAQLDARQQIAALDQQIAGIAVQASRARVEAAQREYDLARGQLDIVSQRIGLETTASQLTLGRLRAQQQVAEALLGLQQAQQGLVESQFSLDSARQGFALRTAEEELAKLRDRGAGVDAIRQQEERINGLKRGAENLEFRAMEASIAAAQQRFALEQGVLKLKQQQQALEAQSAQRAAAQNTLQQRQRLLELQGQLVDPSIGAGQRQALEQQVALQRQAIGLAQQQQQAEVGRLQTLGVIFGLEQQTLAAQQQTTARSLATQAATRGWEAALSGPLQSLDAAAGSTAQVADQLRNVNAGFITVGGQTVQIKGSLDAAAGSTAAAADAAGALANGYASANTQATALLGTLQRMASVPQARWAGGDVEPGTRYRINELGRESFMDRAGNLSMITAPRNGFWTPPTAGTVIPAGITASLAAGGAFGAAGASSGRGGGRAAIAPQRSGSVQGVGKLNAAINRLTARMDALVAKDWNVQVVTPSNAGILRSIGGF
jgi:TP901 family phage tail tape measure protein